MANKRDNKRDLNLKQKEKLVKKKIKVLERIERDGVQLSCNGITVDVLNQGNVKFEAMDLLDKETAIVMKVVDSIGSTFNLIEEFVYSEDELTIDTEGYLNRLAKAFNSIQGVVSKMDFNSSYLSVKNNVNLTELGNSGLNSRFGIIEYDTEVDTLSKEYYGLEYINNAATLFTDNKYVKALIHFLYSSFGEYLLSEGYITEDSIESLGYLFKVSNVYIIYKIEGTELFANDSLIIEFKNASNPVQVTILSKDNEDIEYGVSLIDLSTPERLLCELSTFAQIDNIYKGDLNHFFMDKI